MTKTLTARHRALVFLGFRTGFGRRSGVGLEPEACDALACSNGIT
jgi:hypothetical protein